MKRIFPLLFVIFFWTSAAYAQSDKAPIAVMSNKNFTIIFFFPTEIYKVIEPAENYKFEYGRNAAMGRLVSRKGVNSNLTVITVDGNIFSFSLKYSEQVENFTYVLTTDQAIGKLSLAASNTTVGSTRKKVAKQRNTVQQLRVPTDIKEKAPAFTDIKPASSSFKPSGSSAVNTEKDEPNNRKKRGSLYETDKMEYFNIFCENNYLQKARARKAIRTGEGVELQLNSVLSDKNELYFVLQLNNKLDTEFEISEFKFYVATESNKSRTAIEPLYVFNFEGGVEAGKSINSVYVFKDFELGKEQKVFVVLNEAKGIRKLMLKVNARTINRARD